MSQSTRTLLEEQIPFLAQKIKKFRKRTETIGESNTKAALIDPLLEALGWDTTDPDEVCREYKSKPQDNPVDYALLLYRTPRLFIEAKGLRRDLSDRKWVSQVLGYATVVGVEWCVLTNGDEYRVYNAHAPVDVEQKLFRVVRLSDEENSEHLIDTLALLSKDKLEENQLAVYWKAHFVDRHVKTCLEEMLQGDDKSLIRLIRKRTPSLQPSEIRDSLRRAEIHIDFPLLSQSLNRAVDAPREGEEKVPRKKAATGKKRPTFYAVKLEDLFREGFIAPPLELEREYKGHTLRATIVSDGRVVHEGTAYDSLSTAAGMARKSIIGTQPGRKYPQTNGWTFWKYRDLGTGRLHEVDHLRQQYLQQVAERTQTDRG